MLTYFTRYRSITRKNKIAPRDHDDARARRFALGGRASARRRAIERRGERVRSSFDDVLASLGSFFVTGAVARRRARART